MAPPPHSRVSRYHAWLSRHPWRVLAVALALAAGAAALGSRLELKTAISELLPSSDPGVAALDRTSKRLGDLSLLLIGIRSPDHAANERYAQALTSKLRALPKGVVELAAYNVRDVHAFFEANKWLYVSEDNLETIRDRLRSEISKRKNPLYVSLGDEEPLDSLKNRLEHKDALDERFPNGEFASGDFLWIAALPPGGLFVEHAGEGLWNAAHALIAADPPTRYHPDMRVELGGPVATGIATRKAVESDILWVTVICLSVVGLSIGLYFRRVRAVPLTGVPAVIGALIAFAVAELAFGYLNSSTAFLGSIIVGNGINYAIVLMSRYEEERARTSEAGDSLLRAIGGTWRGTLVASIAASAAYASLMVTRFRGFYQFGVMGAVGSLACWLATFTVLPALLVLLDRRERNGVRTARAPLNLGPLAGLLRNHGPLLAGVFGLLSVASVYGLTHFLRDPFEYDFRKLNTKVAATDEARQFTRNVDKLFGRWPSPTIILGDSVEEVEQIKAAIRAQDTPYHGLHYIGQVVTVYDLLPGPPEEQARKLELIRQIRKLTHDPALEVLKEDERKQLAQVNPPDDLRPLAPKDLPPLVKRPFTEIDGTVGRVVLVYPTEEGLSVWNGRDLLRIASVLQYLHLPSGKVLETSGVAVVFGAMIRSVLHDGPIATVASLLAVLIIIAFIIRPPAAALMALATLILGVLLMIGAAGLMQVRVTFLNFIALPITFGIGAEYALNVVTRYREERNIIRAVVSTGAAVALCSWTTIVGYGSLLAAHTQALRGFGAMAILGEVACLLAAIVALPAALMWRRARPMDEPPPPSIKPPTAGNGGPQSTLDASP